MRSDYDVRVRRQARPLPNHVAGGIDTHVFQAVALECFPIRLRPEAFLERRCGYLTEPDLFVIVRGSFFLMSAIARCTDGSAMSLSISPGGGEDDDSSRNRADSSSVMTFSLSREFASGRGPPASDPRT